MGIGDDDGEWYEQHGVDWLFVLLMLALTSVSEKPCHGWKRELEVVHIPMRPGPAKLSSSCHERGWKERRGISTAAAIVTPVFECNAPWRSLMSRAFG